MVHGLRLYALQVWHGMAKRKTKGCWVGNEVYFSAAFQTAADCQTELIRWTSDIGGCQASPDRKRYWGVCDAPD